jgi:hypothetical protein
MGFASLNPSYEAVKTRKGSVMQYFPCDPFRRYASPPRDPLSTTAGALAAFGGGSAATGGAMALTGIGSGMSALNTLMGGSYAAAVGKAKQAEANFEADQDVANSAGEIASAQRQGLDASQTADRLRSTAVAQAAANGVDAGAGSALTNQAQIAARGRYQADMDLWSGQNQATGLLNRAAARRYTGELDAIGGDEASRAAGLNALATIAGGGASLLRIYGGKWTS